MSRLRWAIVCSGFLSFALLASPSYGQAAASSSTAGPGPRPMARHYDCSKPGNANKAACKSTPSTERSPSTASAAKSASTRHYDCSKPGNANRAVCKAAGQPPITSFPSAPPAPTPQPSPTVVTQHSPRVSASPSNTNPGGPNGSTAKCKDGTYSHSLHHSGTCSRHGGVAQFY